MYVDLVDALRCPRAHAESWLVAASHVAHGRTIVEGALGCPDCDADFPIVGGVAHFGAPLAHPEPVHRDAGERAAEAMRLAALLHLTTPGGIVALGGAWDAVTDPLLDLVDARVLLVEPATPYAPREPVGAAVGALLPLASGQVRGVALDASAAAPERLAAAVRVLGPRGRLVAPVDAPIPDDVRELARDDRHWVAEREAARGPVVQLGRARGGDGA